MDYKSDVKLQGESIKKESSKAARYKKTTCDTFKLVTYWFSLKILFTAFLLINLRTAF